mmetsp:Transcript_25393/g.27760  ORF Transcript_25393/g.27760 Transcript_25393/m.27760 type:complete len:279 (-) Transcript_25393:54-890(-)|eukprot:gene10145-11030_t
MFDMILSKILPGILCTAVCYQTYINLPLSFLYGSNVAPLPSFRSDSAVIIFPGFGGTDENTDRLQKEIQKSDQDRNEKRFVTVYDWSKWRGETLRAAYNSKVVGKTIGRQLAYHHQQVTPLKELHVIGISVGAFAADSCINEYQRIVGLSMETDGGKEKQNPTKTRLTLLDPFTSLGIFGAGYGKKYFGRTSDYCEHFVNTDDPVPFTNDPLPHAMNFDVTQSKDRLSYQPPPGDNMHSWPAAFYGLKWRSIIDPRVSNNLFRSTHVINPRGTIRRLP